MKKDSFTFFDESHRNHTYGSAFTYEFYSLEDSCWRGEKSPPQTDTDVAEAADIATLLTVIGTIAWQRRIQDDIACVALARRHHSCPFQQLIAF